MSILKVANVHFDSAGTNRIDYLGDDKVRITSANGTVLEGATNDAMLRITQTGTGEAIRVEDGNVLIGRSDSTVGLGVKLDVNGAINVSAIYVNGSAPVSGGDYAVNNYSSPATWTKQSGLKGVKVTLISGGGAGGQGDYSPTYATQRWSGGGGSGNIGSIYIPAPEIPGPVSVTVGAGGVGIPGGTPTGGGTSSFGSFISITGGTAGGPVTAPAGGTRGTVTTSYSLDLRYTATITESWYGISTEAGTGYQPGGTLFGWGFGGAAPDSFIFGNATPGTGYGAGGGGRVSRPPGTSSPNTTPRQGGDGTAGFVVVEEFY